MIIASPTQEDVFQSEYGVKIVSGKMSEGILKIELVSNNFRFPKEKIITYICRCGHKERVKIPVDLCVTRYFCSRCSEREKREAKND